MLVQEAQAIQNRIEELQRLRGIAKSVRGFQTRAEKLKEPVAALTVLVAMLEQFHTRGIVPSLDRVPSQAQALKKHAEAIAADFESDPDTIVEGNEVVRYGFWAVLESDELPKAVKSALRRAWEAHVDSLLPSISPDLLSALARIPTFETKVARIRLLLEQAQGYRSALPQRVSTFEDLTRTAHDLDESWRNLGGEGIPKEVLSFLTAAADRQARFDQLTPTVLAWLETHRLKEHLRISFRSSP